MSGITIGGLGKSNSAKFSDIFEDYATRKNLKNKRGYNLELKKDELRKMVRHYFNAHLVDD